MRRTKKEDVRDVILKEDKEIMLSVCDCDRFEDVHLDGCLYLKLKEKYVLKQDVRDVLNEELGISLNAYKKRVFERLGL